MLSSQSVRDCAADVSVVLIAPDARRRRAIAGMISGTQARIVSEFSEFPSADALSKLTSGDCDVIIVDLDAGVDAGVSLIGSICSHNAQVTVMACSSGQDADIVIRSMRAGAREFFTEPVAMATIAEAFQRASARRPVVPERPAGRLFVFQGTKGGVGATTLAINFAIALMREKAGRVVLVDMHPQLGEIALGLGIVPRLSITDALENAGRLDAEFLTTLLKEHESGLMVLGSSDTYGTHRSLERGSEELLRVLREEFAFTVVDAGSCSGNIPYALFEMADTIYLVTEVNLPALRNARRLISCFEGKEGDRRLKVILNRFNSRKVGIDEESTRKALSRPVDWKIPNDYMAVRGAQNLGTPLALRNTAVSHVVRQMAEEACGKPLNAAGQGAFAALTGGKWVTVECE